MKTWISRNWSLPLRYVVSNLFWFMFILFNSYLIFLFGTLFWLIHAVDQLLAIVYHTKPCFASIIVNCLYLDDPVQNSFSDKVILFLTYFSNYLCFSLSVSPLSLSLSLSLSLYIYIYIYIYIYNELYL